MDDLRITFRSLDVSPAAEGLIRQRVDELLRAQPRLTGCQVVVEAGRCGQGGGPRYRLHVTLGLPGGEVVARGANADLPAAIREAFDNARQQMQDYQRRRIERVRVSA